MRKYKVLYLITSLSLGGAEKHVLSLAKEIMKSSNFTPIIACLDNKGYFYDQAISLNIPVVILKRKYRYDILIALSLKKILNKEKITILHTNMFYSNMIGRIAGRLAKVPVIVSTEHGLSVWKNKFLIFIDRITQNYVDKIITVSDQSRSIRLVREKIKKNKIITIHNFVNVNEFSPSSEPDSSLVSKYNLKNKFVIGMLTRLNENKRIQDAILAMKKVVRSYPESRLVILGDGPIKDELIQLSIDEGLENHVIFTGFQKDTTSWLNIFDIFLSISKREDFPVSLLEAMAMSKPVIATEVGGVPEIVNTLTGVLIKPENPEMLSKEIIWMLDNWEKAKKMGTEGRKRIEEHFSQDVIVPQILFLYQSLLADKVS